MKLLSVNLARSQWWGQISDFNPRGIAFHPLIVTFLVSTYKFLKFPDPAKVPVAPPVGEGFKFEYGAYTVEEGLPIGVGLTIFQDGLTAETNSSTEHSDAFLADLLTRFTEIFRSPHYNEIIRRKTYLSQVYVSTEKSLQTISNPKVSKIATFLSQSFEQTKPVFEHGGISFWADPAKGGPLESFSFERAAATSFSENRYFSRAPLQTNKHIELLNKLESILG